MSVKQNTEWLKAAVERRRQVMKRRGTFRRRPAKWLHPINAAFAYERKLRVLIAQAKAIARAALPDLTEHIQARVALQPRHLDEYDLDADDLVLRSLESKILGVFSDEDSQDLARQVIAGVNQFNRDQFRRVVKSVLGVDVLVREPWLQNAMEAATARNVGLIQDVGRNITMGIRQSVTDALLGGLNVRDFTDSIFADLKGKRGVFNKVETRAKLIARDQVGKWNGKLTEFRQTNVGGKKYIWRTSEDERVRPTHAAHDGKTFEWTDPPADTGNPGDDYQCRCYAEMDFSDVLPSLGTDENRETGSDDDE